MKRLCFISVLLLFCFVAEAQNTRAVFVDTDATTGYVQNRGREGANEVQ